MVKFSVIFKRKMKMTGNQAERTVVESELASPVKRDTAPKLSSPSQSQDSAPGQLSQKHQHKLHEAIQRLELVRATVDRERHDLEGEESGRVLDVLHQVIKDLRQAVESGHDGSVQTIELNSPALSNQPSPPLWETGANLTEIGLGKEIAAPNSNTLPLENHVSCPTISRSH